MDNDARTPTGQYDMFQMRDCRTVLSSIGIYSAALLYLPAIQQPTFSPGPS